METTPREYRGESEGQTTRLAEIAALVREGQWLELATYLGFETRSRAPIPREAYDSWGIELDDGEALERVEVLAARPEYRLLLARSREDFRVMRRIMLSVHRRNVDQLVVWWWISQRRLSVAFVEEGHDGRRFVRRMDLDRRAPDPVGLRQWAALDLENLVGADEATRGEALRRHVREVLEQDGLTREFFAGFERALHRLESTLLEGPNERRERHDVALATLLRLVFLYFLQLRGALDGDRRFVVRRLRLARAENRNFYQAVLRPLFFGALNRPRGERHAQVDALGDLPFLNGGLFEPLPVEEAFPQMTWPDEVWREVVEELLERYHFTAEEMQGADEQRAVDPEMLGRVFEGLMFGESRQSSGSFYTPRDIVRRLVDEALGGYLSDATTLSDAQIEAVLRAEPARLGLDEQKSLREALGTARILDPAVGTGAFLLEALQALRRCHRASGVRLDPADPLAEYRQLRRIIHEHLFGVDIQHTAVRLCELRLWLALLTALPAMPIDAIPPLPNLSHRVCVGNSLLSPTDLVEIRSSDGGAFAGWRDELHGESAQALVDELREAQERYMTTHGSGKRAVRAHLDSLESRLQMTILSVRRETLHSRLEPLHKLEASRDLFGEEVELDDGQRIRRERLERQLAAVDAAVDALESGRESRLAFSYATRFGQLLPDGGFDIIITNPPWVRAHRIDASLRGVLQERYRAHRRKLWPGAKEAGIRAPFGPQIDLAALFVERSLELLRPGGRLCGLVPAKLFSSLHGTALREELAGHQLVAIEDYSDAERRMFDATVYPAMIHVQKSEDLRRPRTSSRAPRAGQSRPVRVAVWRGRDRAEWSADAASLPAVGRQPGAPWVFAGPSISAVFEQMRAASTCLGEVDALQPQRGLFTGANDVFVLEPQRARELLGANFEAFSRPVASGRDVRPWSLKCQKRLLWPYDDKLELRDDLPDVLGAYFSGHVDRLEARSDFRPDKALWQMFRVKDGVTAPKVVWRDLSPKLEAALAPGRVIPLNTVYFIPLADEVQARLLAALFNSTPMRAFAYALGERARGGWRRHFAWVMRLLPVPRSFVDFVEGGEPARLCAFDRQIRADRGAADVFAAELFGLDACDMRVLRGWLEGESIRELREAS